MIWGDPGPCPVDDAPHTTCCAPTDGAISIVQLPARDASTAAARQLVAERVQATLPPNTFTTATYRGSKPRKVRRR